MAGLSSAAGAQGGMVWHPSGAHGNWQPCWSRDWCCDASRGASPDVCDCADDGGATAGMSAIPIAVIDSDDTDDVRVQPNPLSTKIK